MLALSSSFKPVHHRESDLQPCWSVGEGRGLADGSDRIVVE